MFAEDSLFSDQIEKSFELQTKDSCHQIWTVLSSFPRQQCTGDFLPLGVRRRGDEEIWFSTIPYDCHGIVVELPHLSRAADEGTRKNNSSADIGEVRSIAGHIF
jgi:hypothetical protein